MNHKILMNRLAVIGIFLAVVLMAMLCLDQLLASAKATEQTELFFDDFSGDLSQWNDQIGTWYIDEGELVGSGDWYSDAWIYAGDTGWTDYVMEVKVNFVSDRARLIIRSLENWWNEYVIDLWKEGGGNSNAYQILAYPEPIASGISQVPITDPSDVRVLATGSRLELFINDSYVAGIDDPNSIPGGRIGLGVKNYDTQRYDDILVTTLPPVLLLPSEQDGFGEAGITVQFTIRLENHSGLADSFNLEVLAGNTWTTTVPAQVGPIEDGQSANFIAQVEIPPGAQPADSDTAIIQASSVNNPSDTANTTIHTTATSGELAYVPLTNDDGLALIDIVLHSTIGSIDLVQYGCDNPLRARLNPTGSELYVLCENSQNIVVLDTSDLSLVATIAHPNTCQPDITFVQFGAFALASTSDCYGNYQVDVIDTASHSIVQSIPTSGYSITSIIAHPYLPLAYAAAYQCCYSGSVLVFDTSNFTLQTIIPNGGIMWGIQTSPDGQYVYASDYYYQSGVIKIDVPTNGIVGNIGGLGELFGLQISPDGSKLFVAGGWQYLVYVLDAINMSYITSIYVDGRTSEIALTCDGSELYVAKEGNTVSVIDTQSYDVTYNIAIPGTNTSYGIAICPPYVAEGAYLSPPSQNSYAEAGETLAYTLNMVNLTGETDSFDLELLPGNAWETTLSTDQVGPIEDSQMISFTAWVEIPADAQPGLTDTATIQATSVTSPSLTTSATIHTTVLGDERAYITLEDSNKVAVVDVATQIIVDTIDTAQAGCYNPWRATLSPDGAHVYFGCYGSGSVLVVETATNNVVTNIPDIYGADDIAFTHTGDYALVGSRWDARITVIDTSSFSIVQNIYTPSNTRSLVMHPYLELAYSTSGDGQILVIDTTTFTMVSSIYVGGDPWDVAVSPDGMWVFAGGRWGNGLAVIDVNTNSLYTTITGMGELTGLEVSNDGAYIYAGGLWNEVWVIDAINFTPITSIYLDGTAWEVALTCDGTQLYVGNVTNQAGVIDALNFTLSGYIPLPGNGSRGIAICPETVAKGAFLSPSHQAKDGGRGQAVAYLEKLFNNSGITETFTLEALGYTWDTQLSTDQVGPLPSGESASFTVTVTVPEDAPWYSTDSVTILATGVTSPALSADAELVTTAFAPAQISVDPDTLESTQLYGEVTTQEMTISNGEGVTLTYDIAVGSYPGNLFLMPLNEPSGSTVFTDYAGNNDGTCSGDSCPNAGVPGRFGTALSFDGSNDFVQIGAPVPSDLQVQDEFSLEAWIYVTSYPEWYELNMIVGCQNDGNYSGYSIQLDGRWDPDGQPAPPGHIHFQIGNSNWNVTNANSQVPLNQWVHIVAVRSANQDAQIYYNAVLQPSTSEEWDGSITYSGAELDIGRQSDYSDRYFNGLIDEVAIYNRALSTEEVEMLYQNGHQGDQTSWLSTDPISGTVPTNSSELVQVTFDATNEQPGVHTTSLLISNNDPLQPVVSVPVTMTVEPTEDMGQVSGSVSDAWSGDPIAATVDLEGVFSMQATPDYSIWAVEGAYSLTAYAEGYYTVTLPVEIIAGEVTEQDIALEPALPRLGELPEEITMSLLEGMTGEQELELFNEGPVPLDFAFFEIEPLKGLGSENHLAGMKILSDRAHCQGDLYYYNSLTSDLTNAGATITENFDPFDDDTLEGYDILWVNDGGCFWTYSELNILHEWLEGGGSVMIQGEDTLATANPASIFGITYQGGDCVWSTTSYINEHPISEGVDDFYIEWTCGYITGSPVSVVLDPWYMNPHVIAAEQGRGKMVVVADNDFVDWVIDNNDNRRLAMNAFQWLAVPVFSDIPWLSENPEQGSVPGHDSLPVELGFDASELTPGVYEGILVLENNDPAQPSTIDIPVTLNVLATEAALSIEPEEAARPGSPGETIVYTFTLTNLGNVADSFILEVSGTWTTTLSAETTGELAPGETFTLVVSVTIPLEAMNTEQDLALVTATSENDPQVSASAQATTTAIVIPVEVYLRYLPLAFKN